MLFTATHKKVGEGSAEPIGSSCRGDTNPFWGRTWTDCCSWGHTTTDLVAGTTALDRVPLCVGQHSGLGPVGLSLCCPRQAAFSRSSGCPPRCSRQLWSCGHGPESPVSWGAVGQGSCVMTLSIVGGRAGMFFLSRRFGLRADVKVLMDAICPQPLLSNTERL